MMKNRAKILAAIIFTIFTGGLAAQTQQSPPPPGEPKDFSVPSVDTFRLGNGLSVTLIPYGEIPKATISLVIRSGNLNEAESETWLADFTGNLIKEGTTGKTGQQIADEAALMGGNLNISTGVETTSVSADVLSEFAPDMIRLIADVVLNPVFPESESDRLKNDMLRDLNIQKSQPANLAFELFSKILYPGHPFGRLFPDQEMIGSFDAEKAKRFYIENFGALRSHIYVAGVFDKSEVEKTIKNAFESWIPGNEPEINVPDETSKGLIFFIDRPGAPQSVLNIGLPVGDPSNEDYIPLLLTNSMLGGSFTSRITMNIRENKGYTYSPYSRVSSRYRTAYWMQFAEVATEVTVPSLKEIFYEVGRLTSEPLTEKELNGSKNYMSGIFVLANSTRGGIISQLAFLDLHGLDLGYLTNYVRNIRAVTAEDVQNVMKKYFKPSEMTIVVVGDREKIGKEITQFGQVASDK
jgi:predicted Zn-dependent peptidase